MKNFYKLIFATVFAAVNFYSALAEEIIVDGIMYVSSISNCRVTGLVDKNVTSVTIPESIDFGNQALPVEFIDEFAFKNCSKLETIILPESLKSILNGAFTGCSKLSSLNLPLSITNIGAAAFENCISLTSINIPNGVTTINSQTFNGCSSLSSISIPYGVSKIGISAFQKCSSLTELILPESVNSINSMAFNGCSNLKSIKLPSGLESLSTYTFNGCGIETIKIPEGVTQIGEATFSGCIHLKSIEFPDGLTTIYDYAFEGCWTLETLSLPKNLTVISKGAFNDCTNLTSINFPSKLKSIGFHSFDGCSSLAELTLPISLSSLGEGAFNNCPNLKTVNVASSSPASCGKYAFGSIRDDLSIYVPKGSVGSYKSAAGWSTYKDYIFDNIKAGDTFTVGGIIYEVIEDGNGNLSLRIIGTEDPTSITEVDLKSPVEYGGQEFTITEIGDNAFEGCTNLKEVTIPENITKIGDEAFKDSGVEKVTFEGNTPPTCGDDIFEGCGDIDINVPLGKEEDFAEALGVDESVLVKKFVVYNGNSTKIIATSATDAVAAATAPNALIFVTSASEKAEILAAAGGNDVNVILNGSADKITLIDDESYYTPQEIQVGTLNYVRNFECTLQQALYVPFSIPYTLLSKDYKVYCINAYYDIDTDGDGVMDDAKINLVEVKDDNVWLKPNHPYIVIANEIGERTLSLSDVKLNKAEINSIESSSIDKSNTFTGNYQRRNGLKSLGYYRLAKNGLLCQFATDENGWLGGFRWYLKMTDKEGQLIINGPSNISFDIAGGTTDIEEITNESKEDIIFNIEGRRINSDALSPGLYIKNGKKILIK